MKERKLMKWVKKQWKRFGEIIKWKEQDESDTGDKNKAEGVVHKLLVFFEKNLNKVTNLDQKTR